ARRRGRESARASPADRSQIRTWRAPQASSCSPKRKQDLTKRFTRAAKRSRLVVHLHSAVSRFHVGAVGAGDETIDDAQAHLREMRCAGIACPRGGQSGRVVAGGG